MSEPTITRTEKTRKTKDPIRLEAGKNLALISREAKERKAAERRSSRNNPDHGDLVNKLIYAVVGADALGGICYVYNKTKPANKFESATESKEQGEPEGANEDKPKSKLTQNPVL
jgi:hypothetical protein